MKKLLLAVVFGLLMPLSALASTGSLTGTQVATVWGLQIAAFGLAGLAILASLIGILVGLLVFRFGWKKIANATGAPSYMDSYKDVNFDGMYRKIKEIERRPNRGYPD